MNLRLGVSLISSLFLVSCETEQRPPAADTAPARRDLNSIDPSEIRITYAYSHHLYEVISEHPTYQIIVKNDGPNPVWINALSGMNFANRLEELEDGVWKESIYGTSISPKWRIGIGPGTSIAQLVSMDQDLEGRHFRVKVDLYPTHDAGEAVEVTSPTFIFKYDADIVRVEE